MSRARLQKEEKVKEIGERLATAQATIFADYRGLTVQDLWDLRSTLAEADTRFSVVKNTLARLAVRQAGLADLEAFLEGPTAVAYVAGDPVQGAKKLLDVTRRLPVLEVKGGLAEGRVLSADQVKALAALETREVMLAKLAGLAKSQMATAAWMFQALQSKFLAVLDAYKDKLPAGESETPQASAEEGVAQGEGRARAPDAAEAEGDTGEQGADAAIGEGATAEEEGEGGS
ncbi:MAG: 50S ribosomal protein L10 [Actinomycetota bacterium]